MALEKITVIDKREFLEDSTLQVRRATYITEDGVRISSPTYSRVAYAPGQDLSHEDPMVQRVARAEWTPDVVRAYRARQT